MTGPIELLISDIDGTLITPDKIATPRTRRAVAALAEAGIGFSLISSRPTRGMTDLIEQLGVTRPTAAFNGASIVAPDRSLISALRLPAEAARRTLDLLAQSQVDAWVFADDDWLLQNPHAPNVTRERRTVGFDPIVTGDFDPVLDRIDKIVGVSNDHPLLARVETEASRLLSDTANAVRSQAYYLDVTNRAADKGAGVLALCAAMGVDPARTAVIGDMSNDVAMFRVAGFSIAMGQSPDAVKEQADAVTAANTDEGFALAIEQLVLQRLA
jgi:Cof subfamily protein (haloacid dehalogenase superfamily)